MDHDSEVPLHIICNSYDILMNNVYMYIADIHGMFFGISTIYLE